MARPEVETSGIVQAFREIPSQHRAYMLALARQYGRLRVRAEQASAQHRYHAQDRLLELLSAIIEEAESLCSWFTVAVTDAGNCYYVIYEELRDGRMWDSWEEGYR